MKLFRLILIYTIEAFVAINILLCLSLNIPYVQGKLGEWSSASLSQLLHTQVSIGRVDMGLLNQVIISDIRVQDQQHKTMLTVQKLAGKIDVERLLSGDIAFNTVQLIRFQANLYQEQDSLPTNFQFVLDALASKDSTGGNTNLRINSLIVRDGNITFDKQYLPQKDSLLDVNHLKFKDLNLHVSIKSILRDSLYIRVRNCNFREESGLKLKNLAFQLRTTASQAQLTNLGLSLPHSNLLVDTLSAKYDWMAANFLDSLTTQGKIEFSPLVLSDLGTIVPQVRYFKDRIDMQLQLSSKGRNLSVDQLDMATETKSISLHSTAQIVLPKDSTEQPQFAVQLQQLQATTPGISSLFTNLRLGEVPRELLVLGNTTLSAKGTTDLVSGNVDGQLSTDIGDVQLIGSLDSEKTIKATAVTDGVQLNELLPTTGLGSFAGEVSVDGTLQQKELLGTVHALVSQLEYKGYPIQEISLDATRTKEGTNGNLSVFDPNIQLEINAQALTQRATPIYQIDMDLTYIRPSVLGIQKEMPKRSYQAQLKSNIQGKELDNMEGYVQVENFHLQDSTDIYRMEDFRLVANRDEQKKQLTVHSDFMTANLTGDFQYKTLPKSITNILNQYLPSLIEAPATKQVGNNKFTFNLQLTDARLFQKLLGVNLNLEESIDLNGFLNESTNQLDVQLMANRFAFNGNHFERANFTCQNNENGLFADFSINKFNRNSLLSLGLHAQANKDQIQAAVSWDNNKTLERFSGALNLISQFKKVPNTPLQVGINILPSEAVVNDTIWNIRPARIDIKDKLYQISHLLVENDQQHHLLVDGTISENPNDSLIAELKDIQVEYVLDAINFDAVQFGGFASGRAYASNLLNVPQADTHLFVRDFRFQTGTMGNMNLYGKWEPETDAIFMEGHVAEYQGHQSSNDSARITRVFKGLEDYIGRTHVVGRISPKYNTINLDITANNTNAQFLQGFVGTVFDDIEGRATGWCKLSNNLIDVDITAGLKAELNATVHALNTRYHIQADSVVFVTNQFQFHNAIITDKHGNSAKGNGTVDHWYLHRLVYDFQFKTPNLLCFDTHDFGDDGFYATAFVGGDIHINGGPGYMRVNADVTTNPGTQFIYDASVPDEVSNTQFITFVDKTPGKQVAPVVKSPYFEEEVEEEEEKSDMNIDLQIALSPEATIKVMMDRLNGNFISANGSGTVQVNFYNKGSFNMFGMFNIAKGLYRMNMQEVIRKDFNLQNGSSVHFNGNPFNANLDLKAIYTVPAVNLRDLSATASFAQKTSTRVNCLMNIEGNLNRPAVNFGLELPTLNEEDKSMVRSLIATDEQMNMQIIYLLGIGRFYGGEIAQEGVNQTNQAMNSILTSTLSSHFNQMLSQVVNNNNWNLGANINPGQQGMNNMEFQTMLQGSLFDNRLQVNGNFGYKENNMMNRNFVGDFDIQWLLNKSGTISLKAYNETNDRYFTRNTLNTQGVGIIFRKEFENWGKIFKKSK